MYIFGEGLPIIIIFTMHYYKFVYEPEKLQKEIEGKRRSSSKKINSNELEGSRSSGDLSISGLDNKSSEGDRLTQYEDYDQKVVAPTVQRNTSISSPGQPCLQVTEYDSQGHSVSIKGS